MSTKEIINKYTRGEATLEETNAALKEAEADFLLDPGKNDLTEEEIAATHVGETPEEVTGYGLLDTGTGSLDKIAVQRGKLDHAVNEVDEDGNVSMIAYALIGGRTYTVRGDALAEEV